MKDVLPWATSAVTLAGMWVVGSKRWWGWLIGLVNQGLWISVAVAFRAWGLLPLSGALIVVYIRNLAAWRRDDRGLPERQLPDVREHLFRHGERSRGSACCNGSRATRWAR